MGKRLSKIATRTGDDGTTGLGDGSRTDKDSSRVHAMGEVDELNSMIGLMLTEELPKAVRADLVAIQHDLFDLGGELCIPGHVAITDEHVTWLERQLDGLNDGLPVLEDFILPGGSQAAATCHLARTVCRRAERCVIELGEQETLPPQSVIYLNRLSDLLFVVCRVVARADGGSEVLWQSNRPPLSQS